jgi:hypothetical protein
VPSEFNLQSPSSTDGTFSARRGISSPWGSKTARLAWKIMKCSSGSNPPTEPKLMIPLLGSMNPWKAMRSVFGAGSTPPSPLAGTREGALLEHPASSAQHTAMALKMLPWEPVDRRTITPRW